MCGRFAQQRPASELAELFAAEPLAEELGERFNVAPTDPALVVVQRDDRRAITAYRWGLIPHWADGPTTGGAKAINARAETVATAPLFRESLVRRRCIVPIDAFYEWQRQDRVRQPFAVRRRDGMPLALAGLWSGWREPTTGEVRRTFTIVTTTANDLIAPLHDRMPVALAPEAWSLWLDTVGTDPGELQGLLVPSPSDDLVIHPVSTLVNNVRNNGPELLAPIAV